MREKVFLLSFVVSIAGCEAYSGYELNSAVHEYNMTCFGNPTNSCKDMLVDVNILMLERVRSHLENRNEEQLKKILGIEGYENYLAIGNELIDKKIEEQENLRPNWFLSWFLGDADNNARNYLLASTDLTRLRDAIVQQTSLSVKRDNHISKNHKNIETSSYDHIDNDIPLCQGISRILGENPDRTIANIGKPISIQEKTVDNQFTPNIKDKKITLEYPNNSYVKYYHSSSSNRYFLEEIRMTFYNFTNEITKLIPENITLMIEKNNNPHEANLNSIRYYCTFEGNEWVDISYDKSYKISGFEFFGYTG